MVGFIILNKMERITNFNSKGQEHGYQKLIIDDKIWYRGYCKNGIEIGYEEENFEPNRAIGDEGTIVNFYIR